MKLYGQLENAQLENKSSNYSSGVAGRLWWHTTNLQIMTDDNTNIRALLRNDQKAIFGNSGTAAQNIRFHRGAAGVLQLVSGADATAEGTLSTALNQLSAKIESYTNGSKPAFGNAGRIIWVTDIPELEIDSGTAWISITVGARINAFFDFVIGSTAQVASGVATHDTWAGAIGAASAGDSIKVLEGTWTENVSVSKQLHIEGNGYGSNLTGSITFTNAADRSYLSLVRASLDITLDSGADLINVENVWLASGKTFVDNGTGNLVQGFQET